MTQSYRRDLTDPFDNFVPGARYPFKIEFKLELVGDYQKPDADFIMAGRAKSLIRKIDGKWTASPIRTSKRDSEGAATVKTFKSTLYFEREEDAVLIKIASEGEPFFVRVKR